MDRALEEYLILRLARLFAVVIPVSSICMIWVFPLHSPSIQKKMESFIIFLRNDVLIPNGKENKETSAIYFEIRIPKKNNEEYYGKSHQKFMK